MRPIVRNLRFDDYLEGFAADLTEAVLQKAAPGQSPHQQIDFPVDGAAIRCKSAERQARAQGLRFFQGAAGELSEAGRISVEAGGDTAVGLCFEPDVTAQSCDQGWWSGSQPSLGWGSAQAGLSLRYGEGME